MARSTRYLAVLTATTLFGSLVVTPPASAGPDDGKALGTRMHIDAPKTYWTGETFDLHALENTPLDQAALWVGKGYHARTGQQQYLYELPANNTMADVGKPGEVYYTAPRTPGGNQDPIWWGYGADVQLPAEEFAGGVASMDLLAVEGPGEVELFADYGDESGPERLLGTGPVSPKSVKLHKGLHTHNSTLFTKPGRYVLTYRSTARDLEGNLIASQPQKLAVQVGGQAPKPESTPSLRARYDEAPAGSTEGYTLSLSAAAEKHNTTIGFHAPGAGDGTLTLLIDGYFLTDLDVVDGRAQWDEALGPLESDIQAVFTPDHGEPGARWISEPLRYQQGAVGETSESADTWMDSTGTERVLQSAEEVHLGSGVLRAGLEPDGEGAMRLRLEGDPNLAGFITGGVYDAPEDTVATYEVNSGFNGGQADLLIPYGERMKGSTVRFQVDAHPTVHAGSAELVLTENLDLSVPATAEGALSDVAQSPAKPREPRGCGDKLVLDHGHVDILAGHDDGLAVGLKDETGIHEDGAVTRQLDDVVLEVPEGAQWGVFTDQGFGQIDVLADSSIGDHTIETEYPAHVHTNGAFSAPGVYAFGVSYATKGADGVRYESAPQQLVFSVGEGAGCEVPGRDAPEPGAGSARGSSSSSVLSWLAPVLGMGAVAALFGLLWRHFR